MCRPNSESWWKATVEQTWPIEHYREIESLEERWQPYIYFRPKAFHGKTITIGADGLTRHLAAPHATGRGRGAAAGQATDARWLVAVGFRRAR